MVFNEYLCHGNYYILLSGMYMVSPSQTMRKGALFFYFVPT